MTWVWIGIVVASHTLGLFTGLLWGGMARSAREADEHQLLDEVDRAIHDVLMRALLRQYRGTR